MVFPQHHGPKGLGEDQEYAGGCARTSPPPHKWRSGRGRPFLSDAVAGDGCVRCSSWATGRTGGLARARPARAPQSVVAGINKRVQAGVQRNSRKDNLGKTLSAYPKVEMTNRDGHLLRPKAEPPFYAWPWAPATLAPALDPGPSVNLQETLQLR